LRSSTFLATHSHGRGVSHKGIRSSPFAERGFCPTCGSTLSMHEQVIADRVQVTVGSLDAPDSVRIDDHVWTKEQLAWFSIADELPRFAASSTAIATRARQPDDADPP
jgi:hypothetical protein